MDVSETKQASDQTPEASAFGGVISVPPREPWPSKLGEAIAYLRQHRSMTRADLAEAIRLDRTSGSEAIIERIETGEGFASFDTVCEILAVFQRKSPIDPGFVSKIWSLAGYQSGATIVFAAFEKPATKRETPVHPYRNTAEVAMVLREMDTAAGMKVGREGVAVAGIVEACAVRVRDQLVLGAELRRLVDGDLSKLARIASERGLSLIDACTAYTMASLKFGGLS